MNDGPRLVISEFVVEVLETLDNAYARSESANISHPPDPSEMAPTNLSDARHSSAALGPLACRIPEWDRYFPHCLPKKRVRMAARLDWVLYVGSRFSSVAVESEAYLRCTAPARLDAKLAGRKLRRPSPDGAVAGSRPVPGTARHLMHIVRRRT